MEYIISLTKENIQQVVDTSMDKMVVLHFFAPQHPESVQMLQTLEQITTHQAGRFTLAKVNCEMETEIAQYFQIQSLPTTLILEKGRPVDGFSGSQTAEQVGELLGKYLPPMWIQAFEEVKLQLAANSDDAAVNIDLVEMTQALLSIYSDSNNSAAVALVLIDVYLQQGLLAEAKALLAKIGLADQDSYYHTLVAKLALAEDAADTPEIRDLQQAVEQNPDSLDAKLLLAKALHSAKRNEEALETLFSILQKDLAALDGKVKQVFMEILTAIGQGNPIANQYRRKLYTLLY